MVDIVMSDLVTCSAKTYKHLCKNTEKLEQIRATNCLEEIKIDHIGKSIFIKGLPFHLATARKSLLYYLESIHAESGN